MELSERLVRYRAKHNLTQKQLGDLMGESVGVIHRFENPGAGHHKRNTLRLEAKLNFLERNDCDE